MTRKRRMTYPFYGKHEVIKEYEKDKKDKKDKKDDKVSYQILDSVRK